MRVVMFYHSLLSDWNHGNAHFLRGVVSELLVRGHQVRVFEPRAGWSMTNLLSEGGDDAIDAFHRAYPHLDSVEYDLDALDLGRELEDADIVIVHEWNSPELVQRVGEHHRDAGYRLLFHDTHHRAATDPEAMARYDLSNYDGVLAYGAAIRDIYLRKGWAARAWTWHEAADTRMFYPRERQDPGGDLVWIGNWGDDERSAEIREFLIEPARRIGLRSTVYGVRYPAAALQELREAGIGYGGWIANFRAPEVFARFKMTVHIPRRPYRRALPGVPTIRVFEALACGIPLISAPWDDVESLFTPGEDFLVAQDGKEMERHLRALLHDPDLACALVAHGLETIRARHTCAHRVDELLEICRVLGMDADLEPELLAVSQGECADVLRA
jgi:spore maturation protein CgeB